MSNPRELSSAKRALFKLAQRARCWPRWRSWPARYPEQATLALLLVVVFGWVYRGLWGGDQLLVGDFTPWYPSAGAAWSHFLNAWSDTNLGWANPLNYGLAVPQALFTGITRDAALAQRLFFFPLLPLGVISMYLLLRYLVTSRTVRLFVPFAYAVNGFTITWFSVGSYPVLVTQIALPLMFLFFLKYLREPTGRIHHLALFTVVFALSTGLQPYTVLRTLLIFPMALIVESAWRPTRSAMVRTLLWILPAAVLYLLLTAPMSTRLLAVSIEAVGPGADGTIGLSGGRVISDTIATLVGNWNTPQVKEMLISNSVLLAALVVPASFIPLATLKRWCVGYLVVAALLLGIMFSFAQGVANPVLAEFPFLLPLQDPNKLQSMFLLPVFLAVAMLFEGLSRHSPGPFARIGIHPNIAFGGVVVLVALLGLWLLGAMVSLNGGIASSVLAEFPFLPPLPDPSKLHPLFLVPPFLAVAMLLEGLIRHGPGRLPHTRMYRNIAFGSVVVLVALLGVRTEAHPPFDNNVTNLKRFVTTGFETGNYMPVQIPPAYEAAAAWVANRHADEGFFRTLWLPDERTVQRNVLPILDPPSFRKPEDADVSLLALHPLHYDKAMDIGMILREFGVRYIIVIDPLWEWTRWKGYTEGFTRYIEAAEQGYVTTGDPEIIRDQLSVRDEVELVFEGTDFVVFEFSGIEPHVSAFTKEVSFASFEAIAPTEHDPVFGKKNAITNGEFQDRLEGWPTSKQEGAVYGVVRSGRGLNAASITAMPRPLFAAISQSIPVKPGLMNLSMDIRSSEVAKASVKMVFYDENDQVVQQVDGSSNFRSYIETGSAWAGYNTAIQVPLGVSRMVLGIEGAGDAKTGESRAFEVTDVQLRSLASGAESVVQSYFTEADFASQLLVRDLVPSLIAALPYLNSESTRITFADFGGREAAEHPIPSDIVVFLGNPSSSALALAEMAAGRETLLLFEGESDLRLESGLAGAGSSVIGGGGYANGLALALDDGAKVRLLPDLLQPSFYRIIVRASAEDIQVAVDGEPLPLNPIGSRETGLVWYETDPMHLEPGLHTVMFANPGGEAIIDQIGILSVDTPAVDIRSLLSTPTVKVELEEKNTGEFKVDLQSEDHVRLFFREAFNDGWSAVANGVELDHYRVGTKGWANGFSVPAGSNEVIIKYEGQDARARWIAIWGVSWLVTIAILLGSTPAVSHIWRRLRVPRLFNDWAN